MSKIPSKSDNKMDKEVTKRICEALDCSEYATKVITINAGKFGPISLLVCANCISKFDTSKNQS
jgi:hypothetical protein